MKITVVLIALALAAVAMGPLRPVLVDPVLDFVSNEETPVYEEPVARIESVDVRKPPPGKIVALRKHANGGVYRANLEVKVKNVGDEVGFFEVRVIPRPQLEKPSYTCINAEGYIDPGDEEWMFIEGVDFFPYAFCENTNRFDIEVYSGSARKGFAYNLTHKVSIPIRMTAIRSPTREDPYWTLDLDFWKENLGLIDFSEAEFSEGKSVTVELVITNPSPWVTTYTVEGGGESASVSVGPGETETVELVTELDPGGITIRSGEEVIERLYQDLELAIERVKFRVEGDVILPEVTVRISNAGTWDANASVGYFMGFMLSENLLRSLGIPVLEGTVFPLAEEDLRVPAGSSVKRTYKLDHYDIELFDIYFWENWTRRLTDRARMFEAYIEIAAVAEADNARASGWHYGLIPRNWFITPKQLLVHQEVFRVDYDWFEEDWEDITQHLQSEYSYRSDRDDPHPGGTDYWQIPTETIEGGRRGDCEDLSFLLASILIAHGYSEDRVYVAFGKVWNGSTWAGHVWVEFWDGSRWRILEPSTGRPGLEIFGIEVGWDTADPSYYDTANGASWTGLDWEYTTPQVIRDGRGDGWKERR